MMTVKDIGITSDIFQRPRKFRILRDISLTFASFDIERIQPQLSGLHQMLQRI